MKIRTASLTLAVMISAAAPAPLAAAVMKCMPRRAVPSVVRAPGLGGEAEAPARPASLGQDFVPAPVVYVLNGRIVAESAIEAVGRDAASIDVVCSDERHRVFGVNPGSTLVIVFTRPGPCGELEESVQGIAELQARYLVEHGKYAVKLEELGWRDPSGLITITLTVSEDGRGWSATGTHRYLVGSRPLSVTASGSM